MADEDIYQLKQKLNETFLERKEQIDSMINAFNNRENLWLYGLTGTGKTALFNAIANGLEYSVRFVETTAIHLYLERYKYPDKSYKLFGINPNTPTILFLEHIYLLKDDSLNIAKMLDIQKQYSHLFPFSFVVAESLWMINDNKTNCLSEYFQKEICFNPIKNEDNLLKLWTNYLDNQD